MLQRGICCVTKMVSVSKRLWKSCALGGVKCSSLGVMVVDGVVVSYLALSNVFKHTCVME